MRSGWPDIAVLGGLWLLFWWPELSGAELLYARDLGLLVEPAKAWGASVWLTGEVPVWAPWIGTGLPYLADPANQALYPFNAIYLVAPTPAHATTWFAAGHVLLGTLGVAALTRTLSVSALGAIAGGATYGLSGYVLSITDNMTYLPAVAWVPVGLACWAGYVEGTGSHLARWCGFVICIALLVLAGDPLHAPALGLIAMAIVVVRAAPSRWLAVGLSLFGAVALGVALGAAQLFPALELVALSNRGDALPFGEATAWSLPPTRLVELFQPWWFGSAYPAFEFRGTADYGGLSTPWAGSIYVGAVPFALLAAAALTGRASGRANADHRMAGTVWLWGLVVLLALTLATGRHLPGAEALHAAIGELVRQRYPEKLVFLATLGLSVLTALALDRLHLASLQPRRTSRWRRVLPWMAVALVVLVSGDWLVDSPPSAGASPLWSGLLGAAMSFEAGLKTHARIVTAALTLLAVVALLRWRWVGVAAVAALVADGLWVHARFPPAGPDGLVSASHHQSLAATLRDQTAAPRVLFAAESPSGNVPFRAGSIAVQVGDALAIRFGQGEAAVLNAGYLPLYAAVYQKSRLHPQSGITAGVAYLNADASPVAPKALINWVQAMVERPSLATLRAAGVTHVLVLPERAEPWRVAGLMPVPVAQELNLALMAVPDPGPLAWWPACRSCDVSASPFGAHGLSFELVASERQTLLTRISALDGWRARLNGRPHPVGEHRPGSDWSLLAVDVPAGRHRLELRYQAPGAAAGLIVSTGALVVLVMVLVMALAGRARQRA